MMVELAEVVRRTARFFRSRVWWTELAELENEAWVAALEAAETWDAGSGGNLSHYAGACVRRRLADHLLQMGTPASAKRHDRASLRSVERGQMVDGVEDACAEELLAEESWRVRVNERLRTLATGTGTTVALNAALELRPSRTKRLDLARRKLLYRARQDRELRSLWKERYR